MYHHIQILEKTKNLVGFKKSFYKRLKLTLEIDEYNDVGFNHYKMDILTNVEFLKKYY